MLVHCPSCNVKLKLDDDARGTKIECPKCDKSFTAGKPAAPAAKPVAAVKKPVKRTDDDEDEDDEDDRPTPKKKKGAKKEEKKSSTLPLIIGGGLALITIVGLIIFLTSGDGEAKVAKKNQNETPTSQATPTTAKVETQPTLAPPVTKPLSAPTTRATPTRPTTPTTRPTPVPADPYAELFKQRVDVTVPTIKAAKLVPQDENITLDVPSFHSLRVAQNIASTRVPKAAKLTHEELKAATVFVNVDAGDEGGSGSGFLIGVIGPNAYIATNHHVIDAALAKRRGVGTKPKVTVVFNSNSETETVHEVQIVAYDPIGDLAILRFDATGKKMPKIIDPYATPKVTDDIKDARVYGFPLGESLKVEGTKYPTITRSTAEVTALRTTKSGKIEDIQLGGGSITTGNSGGPVVDKDGRLIGILYLGFPGTAISFCIPVEKLISLIEGRLLMTRFYSTGMEGNDAKFLALLPVMDPFDNVQKMYVRWWAGTGTPPKAVKDPKTGYKAIPGTNTNPNPQSELKMYGTNTSLAYGLGEFKLPTASEAVQLQIASISALNLTSASAPVTYKLNVSDVVVPTDAQPFKTLSEDPESHVGKVIILRALIIDPPAMTRRASQTLRIVGLEGQVAQNLRFLTSKEFAPHFDEVERDHQGLPVRVTCLVGKKGNDDVYPVRVERVDFIDNEIGTEEHVVQTIPVETDNVAFKLNRDPSKYLGQSLELATTAILRIDKKSLLPDGTIDIPVVFPGLMRPRNLLFTASKDMLEKIVEARLKGTAYKVKLNVKVNAKLGDPGKPTRVEITKIQVLDTDGKPVKTIE